MNSEQTANPICMEIAETTLTLCKLLVDERLQGRTFLSEDSGTPISFFSFYFIWRSALEEKKINSLVRAWGKNKNKNKTKSSTCCNKSSLLEYASTIFMSR